MNDITASPTPTPTVPSWSAPSLAVESPVGELAAALAALDAAGIGYTVISETDWRGRPAPAAA